MQLLYTIDKTQRLLNNINGLKARRLAAICNEIVTAQERLNAVAGPYFDRCIRHCKGICCKNIRIHEIVNQLDILFILTAVPRLYPQLRACAANEGLFSNDCLFLKDARGPCLFPSNMKPERCILTFCEDTSAIARHIRCVRTKFTRLSLHSKLRYPRYWFGLR